MFGLATKKQLNSELDKIKLAFKERDSKILNNSLEIATLKGSYMVLYEKSQSQSQPSIKQSQTPFETKLIQRVRQSKKALVMAEIIKLIDSLSTIEIYNTLVLEKGLCSKASFYRYIGSLKSQSLNKKGIIETIKE